MVYSEILWRPLEFLHFIALRLSAFGSSVVELNDELDHLGLYLQHNDYVRHAEGLASGDAKIGWTGYRESIDRYFGDVMAGGALPAPPEQKLDPLLREVVEVITRQQKAGRRRMASYLLTYGDGGRRGLWSKVAESLAKQRETGRPCPVAAHGDSVITVFCWEMGKLERRAAEARRHAIAVMCAAGKRESRLMEVTFGNVGEVVAVDWSLLDLDELDPEDRAKGEQDGMAVVAARLAKMPGAGKAKLRGNDPCPCGGGKKYKKCHGR